MLDSSHTIEATASLEPNAFDAHVRLRNSGYFRNGQVGVTGLDNGRLRLTGTVSSYYLKQVAQSAVLRAAGVTEVENLLVVSPIPPRSE